MKILWPTLALLAVVVGAVLYGRSVQRRADQLQATLEVARVADSVQQAVAAQHDSIQRDSLARLAQLVQAKVAEAAVARRQGALVAATLRATLTLAQQAQLDSLVAVHQAEVAALDSALATAQQAAQQAASLAHFWRLQQDSTAETLRALRMAAARWAKRPSRCGLVVGVGFAGGYGLAGGGAIILGCRL